MRHHHRRFHRPRLLRRCFRVPCRGIRSAESSSLPFPLVFVSSAYVPVESMPGWLQPVAENQPVTMMVGAVRSLALGDQASELFPHSASWYAVRALAWSVVMVAIFAPLATRKFAKG